jgi:hypothetical protein
MTAYPGRPPLRRVVPVLLHGIWSGAPTRMKVLLAVSGGVFMALLAIWLGHVFDVRTVWAWIGLLIYLAVAVAMGAVMNVLSVVRSRRKTLWWGTLPSGVTVLAFGRRTRDGGTFLHGLAAWPRGTGTAIPHLIEVISASRMVRQPVTLGAANQALVVLYRRLGFVETGERSLLSGRGMIQRASDIGQGRSDETRRPRQEVRGPPAWQPERSRD